MTTIKEYAHEQIQKYEELIVKEKEKTLLLEELPAELLNHDFGNEIYLNVYCWGKTIGICLLLAFGKRDNKIVDEIKDWFGREIGFSFERIIHQQVDYFTYKGEMQIPEKDIKVIIELENCPQPIGCKLTKKIVTKEVEVYEAVCGDTGEAI